MGPASVCALVRDDSILSSEYDKTHECDDELRRVLGTVSSLSSSLNERSADIHLETKRLVISIVPLATNREDVQYLQHGREAAAC